MKIALYIMTRAGTTGDRVRTDHRQNPSGIKSQVVEIVMVLGKMAIYIGIYMCRHPYRVIAGTLGEQNLVSITEEFSE